MENNKSALIPCPQCHKRTEIKIYSDTVLLNFPLWCPICKKEIKINVIKMKMTLGETLTALKLP